MHDDKLEGYWGDLAGEPLLPPRMYGETARSFRAWLAALIFCLMILGLAGALYLLATQPSLAQMQVPQACIELANSMGRSIPPVVGRFKYERAKAELRFLSNDDPAVRKCREALAKMEARK